MSLKIIGKTGNDEVATVYLAEATNNSQLIEFVESIQPPLPREKKWVLIISTLFGCMVGCPMCDAGGNYKGKLSKEELLAQIDYMVTKRYPDRKLPIAKFKIQFSRMGEPALNSAVLDVLEELPLLYDAPGLLPSVSTVAPIGCDKFLQELIAIKNKHYVGKFQLQFSLHTTDQQLRDTIIPIKKWDFDQIAAYGAKFRNPEDKKISLNFALAKDSVLDPQIIREYFDPKDFLIKITPINPTLNAKENNMESYITRDEGDDKLHVIDQLRNLGFEVIVSVGELEENKIGSNCGQYVKRFLDNNANLDDGYSYKYICN